MCTDDISIGCLNSGLDQQIPAALFIELLITIQPSVVCITVWKTVNLRKDVTLDSNLSASFSWRRNNPWVSELHVAMANSNLLRCTELVERWVHATGGAAAAAELCSAVLFFLFSRCSGALNGVPAPDCCYLDGITTSIRRPKNQRAGHDAHPFHCHVVIVLLLTYV